MESIINKGIDLQSSFDNWPIFVLSLASSADRRVAIEQQMGIIGLDFTFIDAVDGRFGLPHACESMVDRKKIIARRGYPMSDGEIACALSHREAYVQISEKCLEGAIILEDDVILTEHFEQFYRQAQFRKADFIQLCYYKAKVWRGRGMSGPQGIRLLKLSENTFTAAAYSISRRAASSLLKAATPITERADWPCNVTKLGARLTYPRIVNHPPRSSSQSLLSGGRAGLIPEDFDFSAGYAKGWRRIITPASWKSFVRNRLSCQINCPF